jgi:hypothetical protein
MDDRERQEIAGEFQRKYGEAIDCADLSEFAAITVVEQGRLALADARALTAYADLLAKQSRDQCGFLERKLPGTTESLLVRLERVATAKDSKGSPRPFTDRDAPIPSIIYELARRLDSFEAALRERAKQVMPWAGEVNVKAPDLAFGGACHQVAEWIRARHRNKRGQLDQRVSWPDVVRVLEFHGHDLSHDTHKEHVVRLAARRFREATRKAETGQSKSPAA